MEEFEIAVQRRAAPHASRRGASMGHARRFGIVGRAALFKVHADILSLCFLIVFDREVVVFAALNKVYGQRALDEKRIGAEGGKPEIFGPLTMLGIWVDVDTAVATVEGTARG